MKTYEAEGYFGVAQDTVLIVDRNGNIVNLTREDDEDGTERE